MNRVGLYLHFPFCKAKCAYCDFYSRCDLSKISSYEKALCRGICQLAPMLSDSVVDTVYFGGGTPSLATGEGMRSIFHALRQRFSITADAEITVEMNPESTTKELLITLRALGANRISFGMQSAKASELSAIGRLHRHRDTERAVSAAKEAGFENISLDLMYGLPGQDLSSFFESLTACVALDPGHVSFYCLTLSPEVPLYKVRDTLPGEEVTREMYLAAHRFLEERGYEHYEISNAARKGFRSRHNLRYWQGLDYLGIGPGAHSLLKGERFSMKEDVDGFISASNLFDTVEARETLTPKDRLVEYVMLSLRQKEGLSLARLKALSDASTLERAEKKLALWQRHGLCVKTEEGFALTPEGFFVSNEIISELI
ncbi:MAG: radical SAM family heme chaperone HemW [Clostridia bacterium]|nr:radical SAM family heme chaperone HemW [Clostridia bacterium]